MTKETHKFVSFSEKEVYEGAMAALEKLSAAKILVLGDVMWDEYIYGDANRISPEAPVPVVLMQKESRSPGGAFNVLKNLIDLDVKCSIAGVVGDDENGKSIQQAVSGFGLENHFLWTATDRPTTIKTRILARNQQLLRVDREYSGAIFDSLQKEILAKLETVIGDYNAVVLSDYDKGMLTSNMIEGIKNICRQKGVFISVDPQVRNFRSYKNAGIMTPNEKEASSGLDMPLPQNDEEAMELGIEIVRQLQLDSLLLTRSAKGVLLIEKAATGGNVLCHFIPTVAREVFDVSGAGDSVIAVYTALYASGVMPIVAALLSNIAGGIVVGRLGTVSVNRSQIQERIDPKHLRFRTVKKEL